MTSSLLVSSPFHHTNTNTTPIPATNMPPKSKNHKCTALNVDETTSKRPWNIKQAQPEEPEAIQEDPEDQPGTSGRQRRGQGKQGGERVKGAAVNHKGKSAWQDCLATTSALTNFNRITSAQKEAAVAKLKKVRALIPHSKRTSPPVLSKIIIIILGLNKN